MANTQTETERPWLDRMLGPLMSVAIALGVLGLPVVTWLDLRALSEKTLRERASETGRIVDIMRGFYSSDVVGRIQHAEGKVTTSSNYKNINGAVPIPATLSIELGNRISEGDGAINYRFVSDLPFKDREAHVLDVFEQDAIKQLRADSKTLVSEISGSFFNRQLRVASPVIMGQACVDCHNAHPGSPKKDWKLGDVRGIQEITVLQAIDANVLSFKYLLSYIAMAALAGAGLLWLQNRQSKLISSINTDLSEANNFLASVSIKIAKIHFAANLQKHLQRPTRCDHRHRTQEAHHLFLRHQGFYRHRRAASARRPDRAA